MFCPKCGEKIPDGIAFCPKCGNKLASQPAPAKATAAHDGATVKAPAAHATAPSPAKPAISAPSVSLDTNLIVPLVIGVIALILAFMPWFSPSADDFQTSQYISDGANNLSSFFGGDSTAGEAYRLKSSYTMLELGDYADTMSAYGSSGIGDVQMLTICWAIPVIISVIGLIMAFLQKKNTRRTHRLCPARHCGRDYGVDVYELLRSHLPGPVLHCLIRHSRNTTLLHQRIGLVSIPILSSYAGPNAPVGINLPAGALAYTEDSSGTRPPLPYRPHCLSKTVPHCNLRTRGCCATFSPIGAVAFGLAKPRALKPGIAGFHRIRKKERWTRFLSIYFKIPTEGSRSTRLSIASCFPTTISACRPKLPWSETMASSALLP